jgi:hypothetical protein
MTTKRELLTSFLTEVLRRFDQRYKVVNRLRMATFQQNSRNDRIAIMGERYTYSEVLYRPSMTPQGQRSASSKTRNKPHVFDVFIWLKLNDDDVYEQSSQSTWDDISEDDEGVIPSLESKSYLEDGNGQYIMLKPENLQNHEVVMDSNPLEMAHFMNFQITIKG